MPKIPVFLQVVFAFAWIAMALPITSGYFFAFLLLIWLAVSGEWRAAARSAQGAEDAAFVDRLRPALTLMHRGVLIWLGSFLVAGLGAWLTRGEVPFSEVARTWSHLVVKNGLLWWVMVTALVAARRRGFHLAQILPWVLLWMAVHAAYCLVQRWTGIDWSHGFDARLGPHRFAYGVYRISGFMGHPLSLGYNLMLILLATAASAWRTPFGMSRKQAALLALLAGVPLIFSGSRFPLIAAVGALALAEAYRALRHWRWILASVVILTLVLWLEGSMIGRFGELLDQSVAITDRFPRLGFWQAHWQMFLDHPIFGVGLAGRGAVTEAYYTALGVRDKIYTAHNIYLQTLADSGLIGLVGFGAFLVLWFRAARGLGKSQGLTYLLIGGLVAGILQNDFRDSEFLYAFWLLSAWLLVEAAGSPKVGPEDATNREQTKDLQPAQGRADS